MRTGAIFARGSCRALKWLALLGVVCALGAVEAAAQAPTLSTVVWTPESATVEIEASESVWTQGGQAIADAFTVTWTDQTGGPAEGVSHTIPGSVGGAQTDFEVTLDKAIPTGAQSVVVTYTAPTPADPTKDILDTDSSGYEPVATGNVTTVTEKNVRPTIPSIDDRVFEKDVAITAFQLPAATGNAAFTYIVSDLPDGLTFDADGADDASGTAAERADDNMVSGTPTMVTDGAQIVTYTVTDRDTPPDRASARFTITVTAAPATPSAPTVTPTMNAAGSLDVMWMAPAHNNSAIFDYEVQYREVGTERWTMHTTDLGTMTSETFPGLTVGTEYEFQVRARNDVGWSDWSESGMGIPESEALSVTVSADPMTIAEGGTSTITAMANRMVMADDGTVTVNLRVVGEATLSASSITIAAGAQSGTVTLTSTADADYVDDTLTVTATGTGIAADHPNVEITVTDPEPAADLEVTVSAAPTTIAEGGTSTITAMANRMVMADDGTVTVNLRVVGEATLSASSITIAAGAQSGTVMLTSTADADYENDTVTVVATGTGVAADHPNIEITVTDPEPAADLEVTVSAAPTTIAEGGTSTITAMANRDVMASDGAVTVNLSVVGEATLSASSITIAAGSASGSVTLTSTADADYENDTVTVVATGAGITGDQQVAITVTDPEPAAALEVTVSAAPMMIEEGGTSTITAMANRMVMADDGTVAISLSVVGDATLSANSITIAAGAQSGTVTLTSTDDNVYGEDDETVTVTASGAGITGNQQVEITVTDNDDAPVLPDLKGQITEIKVTGEVTEKTIGGTKRVHVAEGEIDAHVSVTVQWDHAELTALHAAGVKEVRIWLELQGARVQEQIYNLPDWLSWIDDEGDVDFPNTTSRLGELGAWFAISLPAAPKPTDFPNSIRHHKSATKEIRLLIHHDEHEAENDAFYVEATYSDDVDLGASDARNLSSPLIVIEDDDEQKVTVKRGRSSGPSTLYESVGSEDFTVAADPPRIDLPLTVRLDVIDVGDTTVKAATFSLSQANLTLNAARDGSAAGNSADVTIHLPNPDGNREDDDYDLNASVVLYSLSSGGYDTIKVATHEIHVLDIHNLPPLTVMPTSAEVMEDGDLELTLTVNRNPADTIATDPETLRYTSEALTIMVGTGGDATMGSDYSLSSTAVMIEKHDGKAPWTQSAKVKVEVAEDDDVEPAEMLELDFTVNGNDDAKNGPRPTKKPAHPSMASAGPGPDAEASLTLTDKTEKLVSVRDNAYDVIQAALGAPPTLMTGMSAELMGASLFDYDANAVSVAYATSVDGMAVTASASGGTVTIMGASAGEAKVTITATATPNASSLIVTQTEANVAQLTFPVMVEDAPLTYMVMQPDDMNLVEGGMGVMVKVMTNRAVSENTEVMLMRDGSSSASDDDYMLDPPLVTIMAGNDEGHTMVTALEDGMMENADNMPEMLTLFLVVDGMQMTDESVSFHLWDAAVPALPIIAQLLLAALLAVGGYRRYLRR